jgi:DNA-binding NtrC family response regulator
VPKPSIMVLANEEVISALLGAMVELDGYVPVFPAADEQAIVAIRRNRPDLLLLDCEHDLAWDAGAMRTITATDTRVLLFSAMRSQREVEQIAARYGITAFILPVAYRDFTAQVDRALGAPRESSAGAVGA